MSARGGMWSLGVLGSWFGFGFMGLDHVFLLSRFVQWAVVVSCCLRRCHCPGCNQDSVSNDGNGRAVASNLGRSGNYFQISV